VREVDIGEGFASSPHLEDSKGMVAETQSIRDLRQWLVWRSEERDGKLTKMPYSPPHGPESEQQKSGDLGWLQGGCESLQGARLRRNRFRIHGRR
jgi:hypothetical protein